MMKKLFALLMAAVMLLACSAALAEEPLKIAVIGPLTGGADIYGKACKWGAEVARDEINALGGLQFELRFEDDAHADRAG